MEVPTMGHFNSNLVQTVCFFLQTVGGKEGGEGEESTKYFVGVQDY